LQRLEILMFREEATNARNLWLRIFTIACTGLLTSSCMLSPNEGHTVSSRTSAVSFSGYHPSPNKVILLQSFDPLSSSFAIIGAAVSASTPSYTYGDVPQHSWSANIVIPSAHWQQSHVPGAPDPDGHFARLRAMDSSNASLFTFLPSWLTCFGTYPDLGSFIENCPSPRSPEVYVYTAAYPAGVDLVITEIRPTGPGVIVQLFNRGRHGKATGLQCSNLGSPQPVHLDTPFAPGEVKGFAVTLTTASGQTVVCTVFGVNEEGTAEVPTHNNTRTQVIP
jgi:hypothetical protein